MKKMVITLLAVATMAVAQHVKVIVHKERSVHVVKKTKVIRKVNRPMLTPFHHVATPDGTYISYSYQNTYDSNPYNMLRACKENVCSVMYNIDYEDYPNQLVVYSENGRRYFDKRVYEIEIIEYN